MNKIELPTLLFWENGNSWYGSRGNARFFIQPEVSADTGESRLSIRFWRGPLSMELSEILSSADFPVSIEGLDMACAWLEEQAQGLGQ